MDNLTYAARMRYLDADDVDDAVVDYDGLDVHGRDGEKLGNVDGFIIDSDARRVNYVVVDSGGWFTSRRFLLPIGHATLAEDRRSLQIDLSRDALSRFPDYDEGRFREFTDDELRAFERNTVVACCPDEPLEDVSVTTWGYDSRRHYAQPDWWRNASYAPERLQGLQDRMARSADPTAPVAAASTADVHNRDLVMAQEGRGDDVSPHAEGRAQPGDILGIETGGERTAIGETREDEDKRRRSAERALRDEEPPARPR